MSETEIKLYCPYCGQNLSRDESEHSITDQKDGVIVLCKNEQVTCYILFKKIGKSSTEERECNP